MRFARISIPLLILLTSTALAADAPWIARGKSGMVAADSPEASAAGAEILKAGGNAFDAAIATSLALGVCRPESTGLGGGGFLLAYVAKEERFIALDFRETAPACATPQRYAKLDAEKGAGPSPSIYGGNAIATPGLLAGLEEIRTRFATRSFADLTAPAIKIAEDGFVIDDHFRAACEEALREFKKYPMLQSQCGRLFERFLKDRKPPALGEKFRRPAMADTLRLIAKDGPAAFYDGLIAEAIIKAAQQSGGGLTRDDLRSYKVKEREPLVIDELPWKLISMPPPSSGGVCIAILSHVLLPPKHIHCGNGVMPDDNQHDLIEGMKNAFADRARWLGDPDFVHVPLRTLLRPEYAENLYNSLKRAPSADPNAYGSVYIPDDAGTSHFCIADSAGNIVSMTETINGTFGSFVMTEPFDIILNNQIDDFSTVPGKANLFGLTQSERNLIAPGKRPLSSMSPTIVLKSVGPDNYQPVLAIGGSGGPRIISNVFQVMQSVLNGQSLEQAETNVRFHHQWQPDEIYLDRDPPPETQKIIDLLKQRGHKFSDKHKGAAVQAIQFLDDGTMIGASDPQKGGRPAALP